MKKVQLQVLVKCDWPKCDKEGSEEDLKSGDFLYSIKHRGRPAAPVEVDLCEEHRDILRELQKHFRGVARRVTTSKDGTDDNVLNLVQDEQVDDEKASNA